MLNGFESKSYIIFKLANFTSFSSFIEFEWSSTADTKLIELSVPRAKIKKGIIDKIVMTELRIKISYECLS